MTYLDPYNICVNVSSTEQDQLTQSWREIDAWLTETLGARNGTDHDRWRVRYHKYCFRCEADAMLFALKWS